MKGKILRRGKDRKGWTLVFDLPRDVAGKRKQKWISFDGTKSQAEEELVRLLDEVRRGAFVEPAKQSVGEYLEKWLEQVRPNLARQTFQRYRQIVRTHLIPALGSFPLDRLRPAHVQEHYDAARASGNKRNGQVGAPLTAKTVRHHHIVLHSALERAVKLQLLTANPCDAVEKPRPRNPEMQALDADQVEQLLTAARDTQLYMVVLLAIATGMRRGEILGLRWRDVDFEGRSVAVRQSQERTAKDEAPSFKEPKTAKSRRAIALPPRVVRTLIRHKARQAEQRLLLGPAWQDYDLVCCREDGSPMRPDTITVTFPRLVKKAGLPPIPFHAMRHTSATLLLKDNVHPKVVSERLGHSSVAITIDKYSHVLPGMQEEAAARLDARLGAAVGE